MASKVDTTFPSMVDTKSSFEGRPAAASKLQRAVRSVHQEVKKRGAEEEQSGRSS